MAYSLALKPLYRKAYSWTLVYSFGALGIGMPVHPVSIYNPPPPSKKKLQN